MIDTSFWNRTDWLIEFVRLLRQTVPTLHQTQIYSTEKSCSQAELESFYRHWRPIYGHLPVFAELTQALGEPQCPTS